MTKIKTQAFECYVWKTDICLGKSFNGRGEVHAANQIHDQTFPERATVV